MNISAELILGAWGAFLATVLAVVELSKFLSDRPRLSLSAELSHRTCAEDDDTHGVKVKIKRGDDILCEEVLVSIVLRNGGSQGIQVDGIYVETTDAMYHIRPTGLPVILQPNTSSTVEIQPEYFAPSALILQENSEPNLRPVDVLSFGALDALAKRHPVPTENRKKVTGACRELPLRAGIFQHKETGSFVTAFPVKDGATLIKKQRNS